MDASRTHEAIHEQSIRSWVFVGAVGLALGLAIIVGVGMNTDDVVIKAPAREQAHIGPSTRLDAATEDFAVGRGGLNLAATTYTNFAGPATAIREGGTYVGAIPAPIGSPDSFSEVRESGAYYGAQDGTMIPRRGLCAVKQGC